MKAFCTEKKKSNCRYWTDTRKELPALHRCQEKMKEELQNPVGHLQFLIVYSLNKIIILKYPGIIYFDIIYFA